MRMTFRIVTYEYRLWSSVKIPHPLQGFPMLQSAQAAVTKYHRLGDLNNKHLIFTVLEAGEVKSKVPGNSVPGEITLHSLHTAVFSLSPHMVERQVISLVSLIRALIPSWGLHTYDLITYQDSTTIRLEFRNPHVNLWGTQTFSQYHSSFFFNNWQ